MAEFLLAAEADRIQDLLFRSAQLREVVGGSQLLSRFCDDVPELLGAEEDQVITSAGGSFRLKFENEDTDEAERTAREFGAALAEAYYRATGGRLSVAEPVSMAGGYASASREAGEKLRQAKRSGRSVATPHIPFIAFCESCGVGLAEAHESRVPEEREGHYVCPSCRAKAAEREQYSRGKFLAEFYEENVNSDADWPPTPEIVAQDDPRDYVAYIVADGDGMGRIFGACNEDQAKALSETMNDVLRKALAEPTRRYMKNEVAKQASHVPVLPLILGGDDLFALVPARWGLDFARQLCRTFQDKMTAFVRREEIALNGQYHGETDLTVTMSAAVVICKANYPYYLAHQIGEERLSATKRAVKALGDTGVRLSAVDFEIVLGSQAAPHTRKGTRRSTLRPYWVTEGEGPSRWGLPISKLLDWRYRLVDTPSRRLSQLREHFDRIRQQSADQWDAGLRDILGRIERDRPAGEHDPVRTALEDLGGVNLASWYELDRKSDEDFRRGHGMPDLLRAWDWTLNLDHSPIAYEGGER